MIFWRSKPLNTKEFVELNALMIKLEEKVKTLSSAVTMLEIDLHNTKAKMMKKIKPVDLMEDKTETEPKKETEIFLSPDGLPI
jgi:hypothetical protein